MRRDARGGTARRGQSRRTVGVMRRGEDGLPLTVRFTDAWQQQVASLAPARQYTLYLRCEVCSSAAT